MLYSWNLSAPEGVSHFSATSLASAASVGPTPAVQPTDKGADSSLWALASANYSEPVALSVLRDVSAAPPQIAAASARELLTNLGTSIAHRHRELDPFKIGSPL